MNELLITGDKGYIGSHLVQLMSGESCDMKDGQDFGNIRGRMFDTVIHLAAHASVTQSLEDPDECLDNNAFKLIPFLTCNRIGRLVFSSTGGAIYGNRHFAKEEEASWNGCVSPYGQSKYLAEQIIRRLHPNHVILRFGNVFGGNDRDRKEAAAHAHFRMDNPIVVYGGTQTRDFVHIDVICKALIKATVLDMAGTFNIGSGVETSVASIAEEFSATRNVPIVYEPARLGEIENVSLDITRARDAGLV
jgi:UDP-glucose 4-epimerase